MIYQINQNSRYLYNFAIALFSGIFQTRRVSDYTLFDRHRGPSLLLLPSAPTAASLLLLCRCYAPAAVGRCCCEQRQRSRRRHQLLATTSLFDKLKSTRSLNLPAVSFPPNHRLPPPPTTSAIHVEVRDSFLRLLCDANHGNSQTALPQRTH